MFPDKRSPEEKAAAIRKYAIRSMAGLATRTALRATAQATRLMQMFGAPQLLPGATTNVFREKIGYEVWLGQRALRADSITVPFCSELMPAVQAGLGRLRRRDARRAEIDPR